MNVQSILVAIVVGLIILWAIKNMKKDVKENRCFGCREKSCSSCGKFKENKEK